MRKKVYSLLAALTIWGAISANVQAKEIVVKKGDTLWAISRNNGISVQDIKALNGLSSDLIHPNDQLNVTLSKKYIVQSGDTLWGIARTNGTTVNNLKRWNQLNSDLIRPGLQLVIYPNTAEPSTITAKAPVKTAVKSAETQVPAEKSSKTITVTATAYTASCEGCSGITKTGVDLNANPNAKVIAVDPNVIPLGSKVYVEGHGYATAADTGGAIKGNRIDVFIPDQKSAMEFGRKQVKVTIIN
ncbi:LysM peptidoglycan-binding and 3D domain-containing protein [Neobacillus cucumis]|uniref:Peptidoglycan-binding protein n=1 Tax=Neobacillus cucumis TaxID=1740721 RepID=A0A2N5H7D1_9BACI|nr:3D domain-containing protein [Neobacillus cucumis]PLS01418.1 peptidoglycan-binding protein [Neobacillus cucumis]